MFRTGTGFYVLLIISFAMQKASQFWRSHLLIVSLNVYATEAMFKNVFKTLFLL